MNRLTQKVCAVLASVGIALFSILGLWVQSAGAWPQPTSTAWSYFAIGPPPGSSSPYGVYVTTAQGVYLGSPFAQESCLYGLGSVCARMYVSSSSYSAGVYNNSAWVGPYTNTTYTAVGNSGWLEIGGIYYFSNTSSLYEYWTVQPN